jgi:hypothetical protein
VPVIRSGRRALAAAVTTVALLGVPLAAAPAGAAPAPACPKSTLDQDIARADVVFRGVVKKVPAAHTVGKHRLRSYPVVSDRVYKSSLVTRVVVVTARVDGTCTLPTLTRQVVARLGSGAQPEPNPPATATFTKVAHANPPALSRLLAPGVALLLVSLLGLLVAGRLGRRTSG